MNKRCINCNNYQAYYYKCIHRFCLLGSGICAKYGKEYKVDDTCDFWQLSDIPRLTVQMADAVICDLYSLLKIYGNED